ncbi:MAG: IS66 family transposase [Pseudomonadota bacterium]|nr:IS66 family transposase [Pseudomonadota bacterium]
MKGMESLPDLAKLTPVQKDELIHELWGLVRALRKEVMEVTAKVAELEGRVALNSPNSSKPPSSEGYDKPKPKSLRPPSKNPPGGQKGHEGHTLKKAESPDHIVLHAPPATCECGLPLPGATVAETRQVFDLPSTHYEVTEHQVLEVRCACGQRHRGEFPEGVNAPVQYGPRLKGAAVHLTQHHMLPAQRTADLMGDLAGLPLSDATVLAAVAEARARLEPTVAAIGQAIVAAPIAHADETGLRVDGKLHWLHVLATGLLTWMGVHPNRGKKAFDAFGLLTSFVGTLIHDGWKPYRDLVCKHALCNAHHLRELTYVFEEMGQTWAKRLIELLLAACQEVDRASGLLPQDRLAYFRSLYWEIIAEGEAANPRAPPSGKRGRTRQSKAVNLLHRLRTYADDVLRFMTDPGVPFTNNLAEQAVRLPKVKQKVSGCFRTVMGAQSFCIIRSYLDTLRKQGANLFHALTQTFQGNVPQPRFA